MFASIAKKVFMAVTGLGMIVFLFGHLGGNLLLFQGADKFNGYSDFLLANPLIVPAEVALIAILVVHTWASITVTLENNAARPVGYELRRTSGQSSLSSRTMWWSGVLVLFFIVFHVWHFRFGDKPVSENGLWGLVIREFQKPSILVLYVVCMAALGLHLGHAIGSMFQSVGLRNASGQPRLLGFSNIVGWGLALCFAALPLAVFILQPDWRPAVPITVRHEGGEIPPSPPLPVSPSATMQTAMPGLPKLGGPAAQ
jgi:succinate dehydrogenase / fumarate reductase cytochrome b subunit